MPFLPILKKIFFLRGCDILQAYGFFWFNYHKTPPMLEHRGSKEMIRDDTSVNSVELKMRIFFPIPDPFPTKHEE